MDLSVILPTFNEREAIEALRPRLESALRPYQAEVLLVDDSSPDGTAEVAERFAREGLWRVHRRRGRRGLALAVAEGFGLTRGRFLLVMDADGSHPPETIPSLVEPLREHRAELTLASRFVPGGADEGLGPGRRLISWGAARLARPLTPVHDPMSGFFAFDRAILARAPIAPVGYKIGLELIVRCRPRPVLEVPFAFRPRVAGESKLGGRQVAGYLRHIGRLYAWRYFGGGRASRTR